MKKPLLLAVSLVAVSLVLAAPASAKEILGVQLCGESGCVSDRSAALRGSLHEGPGGPFTDGSPAIAPAKPGSWYRGFGLVGDQGKVHARVPFYYVPAAGAVALPGDGALTTTWQTASGAWRDVLERLATRVEPYPTPTITRASVNGKAAADPRSYLALFSAGKKTADYPREAASVQITLESKPRSPWTDGNLIVVYGKSHLLVRDGQFVSVPARLAEQAAAGESLAVGKSFPWLEVLAAIVIALALAAAGVLAARRLGVPRRTPARPAEGTSV